MERQQVTAALIPALYKQTAAGIVAHVVTSSVLVLLLWHSVDALAVLGWLAAVYVLSVLRGATVWWFNRHASAIREPLAWGRLATLFAGLFGLLWGVCPWLFMAIDNPTSVVVITVINMGLGAGAVVALAPYLPACLAFALPTQAGLIAALVATPQPMTLAIAALAGYALVANLTNSVMVHSRLRENVRLTDDNLRLRHEAEDKNRLLEETLATITQAREAAEHANAAKTRFLAAASHDLRQPLHALGLFFESLAADVRTPATEPLIERVNESIRALGTMLNALLDISKLDAGVVRPNVGAVSLAALMRRLEEEFRPLALSTGNRLSMRVRDLHVRSDELMLERLLRNLLSNALRYTRAGRVCVGVRTRGDAVRVEVYDTGIGIAPGQFEAIFTEFHQLNNPGRDRHQGLGLGLAIVRRIADLLGHRVEVASRPGRGARFSIVLPRAAAPRTPGPASAGAAETGDDLRGVRVLVLDDDHAILDAMQRLLSRWGLDVVLARSVDDALRSAAQAPAPQILLVDYRLAGKVTGIEAVSRLREALAAPVPAVLLTGDTAPDRLRQAEQSAIPLLHKPVQPARLRAVMRSSLLPRPGPAAAADAR